MSGIYMDFDEAMRLVEETEAINIDRGGDVEMSGMERAVAAFLIVEQLAGPVEDAANELRRILSDSGVEFDDVLAKVSRRAEFNRRKNLRKWQRYHVNSSVSTEDEDMLLSVGLELDLERAEPLGR